MTITKHFVTFLSPGTFMAEESRREIESWDVGAAVAMAREIKERHGATPFGFRFSTSVRGEEDFEAKETAKSPNYFLGGKVSTREEVEARNDPEEEILRSNMRGNGYKRIIVNNNSWRWTAALDDDDVVLEFTP